MSRAENFEGFVPKIRDSNAKLLIPDNHLIQVFKRARNQNILTRASAASGENFADPVFQKSLHLYVVHVTCTCTCCTCKSYLIPTPRANKFIVRKQKNSCSTSERAQRVAREQESHLFLLLLSPELFLLRRSWHYLLVWRRCFSLLDYLLSFNANSA